MVLPESWTIVWEAGMTEQEWLGPGSRVGQYVIEKRVGSGGMAVVFSARDESLGRMVALKVLSPTLAHDEEFRRRFLRESRSVAAVEESHIVPVYGAGESDGVLYLATRFVPGGDLGTLLRSEGRPFAPDRAASLISQIASALDAAHHAGLVHRDVKPGNVLIDSTPGRPEHAYLADFGLSKVASSATGLTASGVFMGTPDYCAPEQITGKPPVSARSDQYSLACVAFCLLSGTVPFGRGDTIPTLFAHVQDPVPSLAALRPGLPVAVDAVMATAMAKDPAARFRSCGDFAAALQAALRAPVQVPAPAWGSASGPGLAAVAPPPGTQPAPAPPPWIPPVQAGNLGTHAWAPGTIPATRSARPQSNGRKKAVLAGSVAAVVLACGGIGAALALNQHHETLQAELTGTWVGSYTCSQGLTGLRLGIQAAPGGSATAIFNFYAVPSNPGVPSGEFTMTGTYSANGMHLGTGHWIKQPAGYEMAGLDAGPLTNGGKTLSGNVANAACTTFTASKG
jgi:serine/threonine-protein kinase